MEYCHATGTIKGADNSVSTSNLRDDDATMSIQSEFGRGGGTEIIHLPNGETRLVQTSSPEYQSATDFDNEGDFLSTARTPYNFPVTGRGLQPTDTIEIHGMRTSVAAAEHAGLIQRTTAEDIDGNVSRTYKETGPQDDGADQSEGPDEASGGDTQFAADETTETLMTQLVQSTTLDTQMSALNGFLRTGEISTDLAMKVAEQSGRAAEEGPGVMAGLVEGMEQAVTQRLEAMGVHNEDAFADFLRSDARLTDQRNEAIRELFMQRSTKGLDKLAGQFAEELDAFAPDDVTGALDASGIGWQRSSTGLLLIVTPDHGEVPFKVAVRAGIVKVS